ncbi:MAG: DegT/DnrJ/EryC1/StrS family aminotransferase [Albidovulum sp.]|nr:DegT/DnrJ/EryC1/StrS family aminotransferase [Albidovulum sp.]MDE0306271.1 DegT/DnrJ/EryC1/StrS family aminotransferase [Albidovulum sp.]MDE0531313.1 DegT/DnrJ/EryC1/StrS family aminotransferase [Albidovulum sp.]
MKSKFTGSFTQQEPIPESAIEAAVEVMRSGRLHRYNEAPGEKSQTSILEMEFAAMSGSKYCLAVASCGSAIATALRSAGANAGERVLTNAFTLAPVPGAIASLGCVPALVEINEDLVVDLGDLRKKISETSARIFLASHMRGHICDMDEVSSICERAGVILIEDCAHTMGSRWNGVWSGRHGLAACYSTQTYKHANSGEGGLIISDDPDFMARAIMLSGSYMFYERHLASPCSAHFKNARYDTPNCSARMDNLRAAILRPQLADLDRRCQAWNERYRIVEARLSRTEGVKLPARPMAENFVGSSIQFRLPEFTKEEIVAVIERCAARGVILKWFGQSEPEGFTSRYDSWRYFDSGRCPSTDRILASLLDMRLPLTFSLRDCEDLSAIIAEAVGETRHGLDLGNRCRSNVG